MDKTINEIKNNEDIFRKDKYEIISPYNSNYEIFNKKDFDVEVFNRNGERIILITKRCQKSANGIDTG